MKVSKYVGMPVVFIEADESSGTKVRGGQITFDYGDGNVDVTYDETTDDGVVRVTAERIPQSPDPYNVTPGTWTWPGFLVDAILHL